MVHIWKVTHACSSSIGDGNHEDKNKKPPRFGVFQRLDKLRLIPFGCLRSMLEFLGAQGCVFLFGGCKKGRVHGRVWQIKPEKYTPGNGYESKNDEK